MTDKKTQRGRRIARAAAVALAVTTAVATQAGPAQADGANSEHLRLRGDVAEAEWVSWDSTGCIRSDAFVQAVDGQVKFTTGKPDVDRFVIVGFARRDYCTREILESAFGMADLTESELQIDRLDRASLNATVQMNSGTGASFPVHVQLEWTARGDKERARLHQIMSFPGFQVNSRFNGTARQADVSGTISDGVVNYAAGPASFAALSSVNSGEVVITR